MPIVQNSFQGQKDTDKAIQFNSLYALHLSIKSLISKTLPAARKMTQSIAPNVFQFVSSIFYSQMSVFVTHIPNISNSTDPSIHESIKLARIALKCLRRLVINGFLQFSQDQQVVQLFSFLLEYFPKFLHCRTMLAASPLLKTLDSFIKLVGKLCVDATQERVIDFILTTPSIQLVQFYWSLLVTPMGNRSC